jgi:hypothetical protein
MGLPWKITAQGQRGLCAVGDATNGSALDCDLCTAKESSAPLDGSPAPIGSRGAGDRVTASNHRPTGSGDSRPASAAVPVSAPAREGAA